MKASSESRLYRIQKVALLIARVTFQTAPENEWFLIREELVARDKGMQNLGSHNTELSINVARQNLLVRAFFYFSLPGLEQACGPLVATEVSRIGSGCIFS
jgi:hypothetical protein